MHRDKCTSNVGEKCRGQQILNADLTAALVSSQQGVNTCRSSPRSRRLSALTERYLHLTSILYTYCIPSDQHQAGGLWRAAHQTFSRPSPRKQRLMKHASTHAPYGMELTASGSIAKNKRLASNKKKTLLLHLLSLNKSVNKIWRLPFLTVPGAKNTGTSSAISKVTACYCKYSYNY